MNEITVAIITIKTITLCIKHFSTKVPNAVQKLGEEKNNYGNILPKDNENDKLPRKRNLLAIRLSM